MGLFSKKTLICERCGKEYEARISIGAKVCPECQSKENDARRVVEGYVDYARTMGMPSYTTEQLEQIAVHRQQIMEKYRMTQGISRDELRNASDNYKKLTDEQAANVLIRMGNSSIATTIGAAYNGGFFALANFEKVVVDTKDVFAVGLTSAYGLSDGQRDAILCVVFTNDPYVPAFPMVYSGKLGFFEIFKSKKGRASVADSFTLMCPNLTYPVQELKKLKKQIKDEGTVKGNIDQKQMLDIISSVSSSSGVFDTKKMSSYLKLGTKEMLDEYGYIQDEEINTIMKMDKMFNRNYWKKQIKKLANYDIGD